MRISFPGEVRVSRIRAEEEWARRIISSALDAEVEVHDTGAAASMFDLEITYADGSRAAAEVVAAADPEAISLWRTVDDDSADRWQVDELFGGWSATLDPTARGKRILAELPGICRRLENFRLKDIRDSPDASYEFAQSLGIRSLRQGGTECPGSIYVIVEQPSERTGGMVPGTVEPLAVWVAGFLADDERRDVRAKLVASGVAERHAVVFVPSLSMAPYPVMDLLFRNDAPTIGAAPSLPQEVTHVWAFSSWTSGLAFHWSPSGGWMQFPKL
jgi:hypothetical protein